MEENGFCSCPREQLFKPGTTDPANGRKMLKETLLYLGKSDVDPRGQKCWHAYYCCFRPTVTRVPLPCCQAMFRTPSFSCCCSLFSGHNVLFCRCTLIMGAFYPFPALPLENAVWMKVLQLASDVPNVQCAKRPMCQMSVCQMSSVRNVQCAKCPCAKCPMCE
uniref:Thyroglobulin type-1 domain-containing protein n=1 Tax=Globodera pallida TaxID=36090 RepID=A0A183BSB3_GLOPA